MGGATCSSNRGTRQRIRQRRRFEEDSAAAVLRAPMPGVVVELRVAVGDHVEARQTLVVMEAMKMEHLIEAPEDGHGPRDPVPPQPAGR